MSATAPIPIRLAPADAERYVRLRLRMLQDAPWAFAASPEDDVALDVAHVTEALAEDDNALLAVEATDTTARSGTALTDASRPPDLIAAAGVMREKRRKFAHRAKIWGVFVEPAHRGKGLGKAIMTAAINLARTWPGVDFIDLGVSEYSSEALRLYESLGFQQWGREPETTEYAGRRYDEIYLSLRLKTRLAARTSPS